MNYFLFTYDKHENSSFSNSEELQEELVNFFKTLKGENVEWCASTTFIFSTTKIMKELEEELLKWNEQIYYTLVPLQINQFNNKPIWHIWRNQKTANDFRAKYYPEKEG